MISCGLLLAGLAGGGCFPMQTTKCDCQFHGGQQVSVPRAPVTPEQVNSANAHQKSQALLEELQRAGQELPTEAQEEGPAQGKRR
jgi:hypothetical protein